jgi:NAD(P)-dependent dehydrogenase (short-subunit alcohol dehydrogenase family)
MGTASTRTIVVTGARSGVGRAVVDRFAAEGWQVGLVARGAEALAESVSRTGASAARCQAFPCDVSDAEAVAVMAAAVLARFGQVDVLVNAAGTNVPRRALSVLSRDDWHAVLATNLHGAFYCAQAFLPGMRSRGAGTIVNINSDVGRRARDLAGAAYVSSKFGLAGLAQQINAEESAHGIRACSIFPRDINTPLLDRRPQPPPAEVRARMMQPEDIAAAVWLAATLPPRAIVEEIVMSSR